MRALPIPRLAGDPRRRHAGRAQAVIVLDATHKADAEAWFGTGIQRVTKNILMKCMENPPPSYRVGPVYDDGSGTLRYARGQGGPHDRRI